MPKYIRNFRKCSTNKQITKLNFYFIVYQISITQILYILYFLYILYILYHIISPVVGKVLAQFPYLPTVIIEMFAQFPYQPTVKPHKKHNKFRLGDQRSMNLCEIVVKIKLCAHFAHVFESNTFFYNEIRKTFISQDRVQSTTFSVHICAIRCV